MKRQRASFALLALLALAAGGVWWWNLAHPRIELSPAAATPESVMIRRRVFTQGTSGRPAAPAAALSGPGEKPGSPQGR